MSVNQGILILRKMLYVLLAIVMLIVAIPLGLLVTGAIDTTSLRMALNVMTGMGGPPASLETVEQRYRVPEGFTLELYASAVPRARFLRFTPAGDLLVSRPHAGDIVLLRRDENGDGKPDGIVTLLSGLRHPLGLDLWTDWLYVAESNRISRVRFDSENGSTSGELQPVVEGLTDNGNHRTKTIRFGPDDMLYLAQGSTCNVCVEEDERRNTVMRFQPDGSGGEIIANGLRNSVGFDWAPWDGGLYATDNGRDMLGDDFPPCELNLVQRGKFYGWPYFNGDNIPDPDMGEDPLANRRQPTPPVHGFRAHNAPLGITFVDGSAMPGDFDRAALVALHGSWNRSEPDGYKVVSLHWNDNGIEERDFLSGFNLEGDIRGRPVDVAQAPDGSIYVSDDYAGAIYRVSFGDNRSAGGSLVSAMPADRLDGQPPAWLADADLEAMNKRGAAIYQRFDCGSCHERGENPVSLAGLSERLGYNAVIETLNAPQSPMPLYPLNELEQRELAVYLLDAQQP